MAIRYGKTKAMKGFPIGSIVPWASDATSIPDGWIICSGTVFEITRYPLLYDVIGNVYGGTPNSTFAIPELTQERAVVDIYPGYYNYLKTVGIAHYETDSSTRANDPFWINIGETNNLSGNFNHLSTIDVVGQIANPRPNLVATVKNVIFSRGDQTETYGIHPRKLSDRHLAEHGHGVDIVGEISSSFRIRGDRSDDCRSNGDSVTFLIPDCSLDNVICNQSLTVGTRRVPNNASGTYVRGGSTHAQSSLGLQNNGNGFAKGDMYANTVSSGANFASDLSSDTSFTWAAITGHTHTATEGEFRCNVSSQKDYTFYDISSNGISLNQPPPNAATINMNSQTPNLTMLFIIRAY
jgi:hypothetical protein